MPLIGQDDPDIILDFQANELDSFTKNVPVRFSVGDVHFFGTAEDPYFPVSVADFAPRGLACVRVLETNYRATLDINEGYGAMMLFQRDGDEVTICFPVQSIAVRVTYEKLSRSWMDFASRAREAVFARFPGEIGNSWWTYEASSGTWPHPLLIQRITHPGWFERGWHRCF